MLSRYLPSILIIYVGFKPNLLVSVCLVKISFMAFIIHRLFAGNRLRNFNYVIEGSTKVWLIDPYDANQISTLLSTLNKPVVAIINTHEHHDHIRGNEELARKYNSEIWAHPNAHDKIPNVARFLAAESIIELEDGYQFRVLDTPGHTHAHLCLLLLNQGKIESIFTGDTLFNAGVGNCHNGGDPELLFETIHGFMKTLPDDIKIYPGHDYMRSNLAFTLDREPSNGEAKSWLERHAKIDQEKEFWQTRLGQEKLINTFLRLDQASVIDNLPGKPQDPKQVFLTLRELRNRW